MRARVPASTANLGPGFDALGLALARYVEVDLVESDALSLCLEGYRVEVEARDHLAVRVARRVLGHDRFAMTVRSDIPPARGLGSSASLALAAAAAAGAPDPLALALDVDGHPENAAASCFGGLVVATMLSGQCVVEPLSLDPDLRFVLVIPEAQLATEAAREVLPVSVALSDAVFNLSRVALLLVGLADHRRLRPEAMEDRLHQRYRGTLLPFADDVLSTLLEAGALGACWSGAGSAMLGVVTAERAVAVAGAVELRLESLSVPGEVQVLEADRTGLVTS